MEQRHHYFNLVFGGIGKQNGVISRVIRFDKPYVTHAQIQAIKADEGIEDQAPLLSCNYLGKMTEQEWSNELWQPQQPNQQITNKPTSQPWTPFQKCLTALLAVFALLLSASLVMMYLNLHS